MAADETLRPAPTVPREPSGASVRASSAPTQAADRHSARATFFPGLTRLDLWHEEEG
jgi:hypothetical protein